MRLRAVGQKAEKQAKYRLVMINSSLISFTKRDSPTI